MVVVIILPSFLPVSKSACMDQRDSPSGPTPAENPCYQARPSKREVVNVQVRTLLQPGYKSQNLSRRRGLSSFLSLHFPFFFCLSGYFHSSDSGGGVGPSARYLCFSLSSFPPPVVVVVGRTILPWGLAHPSGHLSE